MDKYYDQFVITRSTYDAPPEWCSRRFHEFCVYYSQSLSVKTYEIVESDLSILTIGTLIPFGWQQSCLGIAKIEFTDFNQFANDLIRAHWGRYAFVLRTNSEYRLYLDAAGSLAITFNPGDDPRAGSTPTVLLHDKQDNPLSGKKLSEYPSGGPEQYFPAGLTSVDGIHRLLPNHYLCLRRWKQYRHWPSSHPVERKDEHSVSEVVKRLAETITQCIDFAVEGNALLGLTAGNDTRMLLACASKHLDAVTSYTFDYSTFRNHRGHRIDLDATTRLARLTGLKHRTIQIEHDIPEDVERAYLLRVGFCVGGWKCRDFYLPLNFFTPRDAIIYGFGGEIARSANWPKSLTRDTSTDANYVLDILHLPRREDFLSAVDKWLDPLREYDVWTLMDLAYIEQRIGCLVAPRLYGFAHFRSVVLPFLAPRFIDNVMSLPVGVRKSRNVARDIIIQQYPELLDVRVNDYTSLLDRVAERCKWKLLSAKKEFGSLFTRWNR